MASRVLLPRVIMKRFGNQAFRCESYPCLAVRPTDTT